MLVFHQISISLTHSVTVLPPSYSAYSLLSYSETLNLSSCNSSYRSHLYRPIGTWAEDKILLFLFVLSTFVCCSIHFRFFTSYCALVLVNCLHLTYLRQETVNYPSANSAVGAYNLILTSPIITKSLAGRDKCLVVFHL